MQAQSEKHFEARMGWRGIFYTEQGEGLSLSIEPMAKGLDLVYVPDELAWLQSAPTWAQYRREEILERLKAIPWNRRLNLQESSKSKVLQLCWGEAIPGSLESTRGGRKLERMQLFKAGGRIPHYLSHKLWHFAVRQHGRAARGKVNIFLDNVPEPNSVFDLIEIPELRSNPYIVLNIRQVVGDDTNHSSS